MTEAAANVIVRWRMERIVMREDYKAQQYSSRLHLESYRRI